LRQLLDSVTFVLNVEAARVGATCVVGQDLFDRLGFLWMSGSFKCLSGLLLIIILEVELLIKAEHDSGGHNLNA